MTLDEELRLSYYKRVSPLNAAHEVWLVQHTVSGRIFVQKRLRTYSVGTFKALMEEPIPGIPRIYEAVEDNGTLIVIEQYIDGETLSEALEKRGVFSEEETLSYAKQLALILKRLHSLDPPVIHRDIKPSNVIISEDGSVTLIDFDAAKLCSKEQARDTALIGTAGYAAPEQYGFAASGPQTDIYSLGVLMSVMLTGALPSEKKASGRLRGIIAKCLKLNPESRYASADQLLGALSRVSGGKRAGSAQSSLFRPLGFRSLTPWKMILAVIGYAGIFMISTFADYEGVEGKNLWVFRIGLFIIQLALMLLPSNFCGVLDKLGISRIKNRPARIAVIVVFEFVMMIVLMAVLLSIVVPKGAGTQ